MSKKFSIVALGSGGMRRVVAYYDDFASAFRQIDEMTFRDATIGFHVRYDLLCDGSPFFWTSADARTPEEVCRLLDDLDMFEDVSREEKLRSTREAMDAGVIFADGEAVAILPQ